MKNEKLYVGFDIGTNSVGYAVTDNEYNLKRYKGNDAWGSCVFDEASLCDERRSFRTARRRLERRKQRVLLLQEIFANDIAKVDPRYYIRLKESALYRDETEDEYSMFCDSEYTDADYHKDYPTIHHLIVELMNNKDAHDVRLVYNACAWLVAHRGHFLSNISVKNLESIKDFSVVYENLRNFFSRNGYCIPWNDQNNLQIGEVLKDKIGITAKYQKLKVTMYGDNKPSKMPVEDFPYNQDAMVGLLAGKKIKISDLFCNEEYNELGSIALSMDDDKFAEIYGAIGDDCELIQVLREVYDWATLVDVLGDYNSISESKVHTYDIHSEDLKNLKYLMKKYSANKYNEMFRKDNSGKYGLYVKGGKGTLSYEDFTKYVLSILKGMKADDSDQVIIDDMISRIDLQSFMPKQKNSNNRVIPQQLYQYELIKILDNASDYLSFLNEVEDGISVKDKIISIFTFKIPYYVGPLNAHSKNAWIQRKDGAVGKIYPWNFDDMVDKDASEQQFIRRMTNVCTYLPGEDVLPKDSLLYQKFMVLNEINNIKINEDRITVELKQKIYNELFKKHKKVTRKKLIDFLLSNGEIEKGDEEKVSGIDINIKSALTSYISFRNLLDSKILSEDDVERIIERSTYSDDKSRFRKWLIGNYGSLSAEDVNYVCSLKFKDFGRLSKKLLAELQGGSKETGEVYTVIRALWDSQYNLSEILLSDEHFTFRTEILKYNKEYYSNGHTSLEERLDDLYISNAVRRPVYRTLAIMKDVEKAFGKPDKIFIEMARGADEKQKGKRTSSRLEQIKDLYQKCKDEDVRILQKQLDEMGDYANNRLQSDKLFLYYMQKGKCMYTGEPIKLEELGTKLYDIDHIYPQSYVTDDSILQNKVLVKSELNGKKSNVYPIEASIRQKMHGFWENLHNVGLITDEKYKRLVRSTPFTDDEKQGFINRQFVETTQSTKAVAAILADKYPEAEIIYCKARLTSDFRHEFDCLKSRTFNDLHHAVDAYLNIVTGNVYNMKFTKKWFNINQNYSVNPKTIFTHEVKCGEEIIWDGNKMLDKVKHTARKNSAHLVKYQFFKKGGFFNQMPCEAAEGLIPRKKNLPAEKYGGYNKPAVMFFIPVRYNDGKKTNIIVMSVEQMYGEKFLRDEEYAKEYSVKRLKYITGKTVTDISFPMGLRPWKINTVLELDGYRVALSGISSGGKCLRAQPFMPFKEMYQWCSYIKKLEKINEKITNNPNYKYDEKWDKICDTQNIELYDIYISKYTNSVCKYRVNNPAETLKNGRDKFIKASIENQIKVLLNIHSTFNKESTGGVDLTEIGGVKKAAATSSFSATMSNWRKQYIDVRLIDISSSGIYEKKSMNLLELL